MSRVIIVHSDFAQNLQAIPLKTPKVNFRRSIVTLLSNRRDLFAETNTDTYYTGECYDNGSGIFYIKTVMDDLPY